MSQARVLLALPRNVLMTVEEHAGITLAGDPGGPRGNGAPLANGTYKTGAGGFEPPTSRLTAGHSAS